MEMQANYWLPLTEYALRSGMSISTLRRKIKANSIHYKMEDGRYLIRCDDLPEEVVSSVGYASTDIPRIPVSQPQLPREKSTNVESVASRVEPAPAAISVSTSSVPTSAKSELEQIREELRQLQSENALRWKALEARVAGIAKKLDMFSEQMAELNMLVKIFEERLDSRV